MLSFKNFLVELASSTTPVPAPLGKRVEQRVKDEAPLAQQADAAATEFFGSVQKMAQLVKDYGIKPELKGVADTVKQKAESFSTGSGLADTFIRPISSAIGGKISDVIQSDAASNIATRLAMRDRHSDAYKKIDNERQKLLDSGKSATEAEKILKDKHKNYYYTLR